MHPNMRNFTFGRNIDGRRSSLDVPTHGRIPSWLEDLSSSVEQTHSLIMDDHYMRRCAESINNDKLNSFPSDKSLHERCSAESTPSTSIRYGRRASSSQSAIANKNQYISVDMDTFLVPKVQTINYDQLSESQYDSAGFKPIHRNTSTSIQDKDTGSSKSSLESYSPSILEQTSGRRSRLEVLDDTIVSKMKELPIGELVASKQTDCSTKNYEFKLMPGKDISQHSSKAAETFSKDLKYEEGITKFLKSNEPSYSKLLMGNDSRDATEKNLNFEYEFALLKNKIQKYKKMKYNKKSKHKTAGTKKENIPSSSPQTVPENVDDKKCLHTNEVEDLFIIPELPGGSVMVVDILSTWGDRYYVGLNGIELFNSNGNIIEVKKITACPEDVNVLPECRGDPRIVSNLLDGVNRTQDDTHLWLTPFEAGQHHLITIEFVEKTELAMIRIWNYNKSRIHSYRGAKDVVITLDGVYIFKGEIAQACGSILAGIESFGDTILFTVDEAILEKIAVNDISYTTLISVIGRKTPEKMDRPATASAVEEVQQRPYTQACSQKQTAEVSDQLFGAQRLDIILMLNWGRTDYIGVTGLEVIGDSDISITIPKETLRSNNLATGAMLARLIDDENITTDRKHMWYTQYIPGEEITISIFFDKFTYIAGIRIWNYNENLEMTFCGVRLLKIYLDSQPMINPITKEATFLVRRAPGTIHYDFVQEIRFSQPSLVNTHEEPFYDLNTFTISKEDLYDNPILPEGFVFQIVIYTTWGDQYYVGLNGLELFDQNGKKIILTESNICAHPESVNVLPGVSGDIRTPDKLVDGINDRSDGTHSWLVPVIPKCLNRIYIVFDQPVIISVMKIWNYLKTPARGVKEFGVLVDDLLIYNGILDKINDKSSVKYRTILFTNNKHVLQKEMASLVKHSIDSQTTVLMDNEQRMTTGGSLPNADQSLRPFTSVSHLNRGRTSQSN